MDQSKFTRIATQLMDVIDSQYVDDAKLESVMILAAVERGGTTHLHYPASDDTTFHEALGMLDWARERLLAQQGWGEGG
jgi:ribonuclease PH